MKRSDPQEDFLTALNARSRQYADEVESGDLPKSYACLEVLASIFSAYEAGIDGVTLTSSYPVKAWRDDQVSVPRALLRPLVEGWMKYLDPELDYSLGEAFEIEGGGAGRRPTKVLQKKIDRDRRLSNLVIVDYLASQDEGAPISQDAAFQAVADAEGVSYETVKKAYRKHSPSTLKGLQKMGVKIS